VQSGICKVVPVCATQAFRNKKCGIVYPSAAEIRGSDAMSLHHPNSFKLCGTESCWGSYKPAGIQGSGGSAPHTHKLSTTVNGHEWSASYQATPMSSEQVGWEPELAWALWSKESCHTCGLLNISTMLSQLCLITASTKKL
jgi:hypothetical protein